MADLFAPKLRGEPSYESPIQAPQEAPTYFEGIAKLGEFAFDAFTAYEKAEAKRQKATTSGIDPNLAVFAQDVQTIEKIRQEQGQQAANLFERQIAKKYAAAGIELDDAYETVYETSTGRPFDGYGRDTQAYMLEEALKRDDIQSNYWASFVDLGPDATEEQRVEYAIGTQAEIDSAALSIARINSGQQKTWTLKTEAEYESIIDNFLKQGLGELNRMEMSGQLLGAQDILNVESKWSTLTSMALKRPPGVTNEQWAATQARIGKINDMFATFKKATSNEVALEQVTRVVLSMIDQQEGGSDAVKAVTKLAFLKDPNLVINMMSGQVGEFATILSQADSDLYDITRPNILGSIMEQSEEGIPIGNTNVLEYSKEVAAQYANKTAGQIFNNLRAANQLTMMITPDAMNGQDARDQFESASYAIGLSLSQGGGDNFYSAGFLKKLIGNEGFISNVNRFAQIDPEGGVAIRSTLLTGLAAEGLRQGKNLASIERSVSGAEWDGTKYTVDVVGLEDRAVPSARRQAFLDSLNRYYGGDLITAAKDDYRRMGEVQDVLSAGGFYNISDALDRREAIKVLDGATAGLQEAREGDEALGPDEAGTAEVEQPSPVGDVVLALGTNDFSNPEQAANNTRELIREVKARGGNPVIVPPNVNSEQFRAVADAIIAVANEEGATIEMAQYDPNDPLHLTMSEAERINQKYSGAQVVGDSNAVRIMGMKETDLTKTGAGTKAIREAFGKSDFGDGRSTPAEQPDNQEPGTQPRVGVKLPPNIEPEFVEKTVRIANDLGIPDPDDLFTVMSFETVGNMTPDIRNPRSGAVGLIQFTNIGIRDLGVTKDELARMDRIEQLDYVERYLQPYKGKMKNLGDVYMAVFSPIGVGKPDSYPLYKAPTQEYEQNREMDTDRDGIITRGDAIKKVSAHQSRIKL